MSAENPTEAEGLLQLTFLTNQATLIRRSTVLSLPLH